MMIRRSFCSIVLLLALFSICGRAQRPQAARPAASATIAAKKPVFAGACKACPWGILARVTADALSFYGYQTTICWVCWSSFGPREMADKTKPVMPPGAESNAEYIEPPPDAVPDISATSESNLIDAWNGTGPYASDGKRRRNYRVIAVIRTSTYMLAAASKKSGITNLKQIKDRTEPTWIVGNNRIVFDYYGITEADLRAKGGGIMPSNSTREKRASGDVFIGTGMLANTPEQRSWYEASQLNDLVFLDFDQPVIARLALEPGYQRATVPLAFSPDANEKTARRKLRLKCVYPLQSHHGQFRDFTLRHDSSSSVCRPNAHAAPLLHNDQRGLHRAQSSGCRDLGGFARRDSAQQTRQFPCVMHLH
jgi:hypothetical protein